MSCLCLCATGGLPASARRTRTPRFYLRSRPLSQCRLNRRDQRRHILRRHLPHLLVVQAPVDVHEDVPRRDDLAPRQRGHAGPTLIADAGGRLADDLERVGKSAPEHCVFVKVGAAAPRQKRNHVAPRDEHVVEAVPVAGAAPRGVTRHGAFSLLSAPPRGSRARAWAACEAAPRARASRSFRAACPRSPGGSACARAETPPARRHHWSGGTRTRPPASAPGGGGRRATAAARRGDGRSPR